MPGVHSLAQNEGVASHLSYCRVLHITSTGVGPEADPEHLPIGRPIYLCRFCGLLYLIALLPDGEGQL